MSDPALTLAAAAAAARGSKPTSKTHSGRKHLAAEEEKQAPRSSVSPWQEEDEAGTSPAAAAETSTTTQDKPAKRTAGHAAHNSLHAVGASAAAEDSKPKHVSNHSGSSVASTSSSSEHHAPAPHATPVKAPSSCSNHLNLTPRQDIVRGTPVSLPPVGSPSPAVLRHSRGGKHGGSHDLSNGEVGGGGAHHKRSDSNASAASAASEAEPSMRSNPLRTQHPAFAPPAYIEGQQSRPSSGAATRAPGDHAASAAPQTQTSSPAPHQSPSRMKRSKPEGPSALGPASPIVPFSYDELPAPAPAHGHASSEHHPHTHAHTHLHAHASSGHHRTLSPAKVAPPAAAMSQAALAVEQQRAIMHRVARAEFADFADDETLQVHASYPQGLASHAIAAATSPAQQSVVQKVAHKPHHSPSQAAGAGGRNLSPSRSTPSLHRAPDAAYAGVRAELGSPATFLAPDYSIVAMPQEVDAAVRAATNPNPHARAAQLLGNSEISSHLRQVANAKGHAAAHGESLSSGGGSSQKFDARSDAALRAALHKSERQGLLASQARDAAARRRALHEAGLLDESREDEMDVRNMARMERELLPPRVGLPWFNPLPSENNNGSGSSPQQRANNNNNRSPTRGSPGGRTLAGSQSTPSLLSRHVVSPTMTAPSTQIASSQHTLTHQPSAANLATHYSNTGKLLQLNALRSSASAASLGRASAASLESVAPIIAQVELPSPHAPGGRSTGKVHLASMAAMVASSTVSLGVNGQPLPSKVGLLADPAEGALHATPSLGGGKNKGKSPAARYQPVWPSSKVSQFQVERANAAAVAAMNVRQNKAFKAMPLEYQAHLLPPAQQQQQQHLRQIKPGRRSSGGDYAYGSSPGSSHGMRPGTRGGAGTAAPQQLSPLKSLLSSLNANNVPASAQLNVFGTDLGEVNPYQSYLLNPGGAHAQQPNRPAQPGALWTDQGFNRSAAVAAARASDEKEASSSWDSQYHGGLAHSQSQPALPSYHHQQQHPSQSATRAPTRDGRSGGDVHQHHYPSANPSHVASNPNLGHNNVGHRYQALPVPVSVSSDGRHSPQQSDLPRSPIPLQTHGFDAGASDATKARAAQLAALGLSKEGAYSHQLSLLEGATLEASEAAYAHAHAQATQQSRGSTGAAGKVGSPVVVVPQPHAHEYPDAHAGSKHVFGKAPLPGGIRTPSAGGGAVNAVHARPMAELTHAALSAHEDAAARQSHGQQQFLRQPQHHQQPLEPWQQQSSEQQHHHASASHFQQEEEEQPPIGATADVFERAVFVEASGAATSIQAAFRGHVVRKQMQGRGQSAERHPVPAASIESAPEGHAAELHSREELVDASAEEHQAATKLQALQRGRQVRKSLHNNNETTEPAESQEQPVEASEEEHHAATVLQAAHRGRLVRKSQYSASANSSSNPSSPAAVTVVSPSPSFEFEGTPEEHEAATKLQALQRGRQVRSAKQQHSQQQHEYPAGSRTVAAPALPVLGTAEENRAATKIQALQRGRLARKSMRSPMPKQRRQPQPHQQHAVASSPSADEATEEEHQAATKLQALQRGRQVRKAVSGPSGSPKSPSDDVQTPQSPQASPEEHQAATVLQAAHRGRQVRMSQKSGQQQPGDASPVPTQGRSAHASHQSAAQRVPQHAAGGVAPAAHSNAVPAKSGASVSAAANKPPPRSFAAAIGVAPSPPPAASTAAKPATMAPAAAATPAAAPAAASAAAEPDNFGFTGTPEEHGVARMLQAKARARQSQQLAQTQQQQTKQVKQASLAGGRLTISSEDDSLGLNISPIGSTKSSQATPHQPQPQPHAVAETPINSRKFQLEAAQAELRDAQREAQLREAQRRAAKRIRQAKRAAEAKARAAEAKASPPPEPAPIPDDPEVVVSSDTDSELDEPTQESAVDPAEKSVLAALAAPTLAHPALNPADAGRAARSTINSYLYEQHQHEAATKLQALQRGRSVRRQLRAERRAEAGLPPVEHRHGHHAHTGAGAGAADVLSIDQASEEAHAAAAKIQALHRGRSVRRQMTVAKDGNNQVYENSVVDGADRPATPLAEHYRRHIAAVKIQALARGRAVRNKHGHIHITGFDNAEGLRRALQEWSEAEAERKRVMQQYTALAKCATSYTYSEYTEMQRKAAEKIQAVQRGRMVRRKRAQEKRMAAQAKAKAEAEAAAAAAAAAVAESAPVVEEQASEPEPAPAPVVIEEPAAPAPAPAAPWKPRNRTKAEIFAGPPTPPGGWPSKSPPIPEPLSELARDDSLFGRIMEPLATPSPELLARHEEKLAALARGELWHAIDPVADAEAHAEAQAVAAAAIAAAKRKTRRASQAVPVTVSTTGQVSLRERDPARKRAPQVTREYSDAEREAAAVKIQSALRGAVVRKKLRAEKGPQAARPPRRRLSRKGTVSAATSSAAAAASSSSPEFDVRANTRAALRASQRRSQAFPKDSTKDSPQRSPALEPRGGVPSTGTGSNARRLSAQPESIPATTPGTPEEHQAATKLQALQRGRAVRKEVAQHGAAASPAKFDLKPTTDRIKSTLDARPPPQRVPLPQPLATAPQLPPVSAVMAEFVASGPAAVVAQAAAAGRSSTARKRDGSVSPVRRAAE